MYVHIGIGRLAFRFVDEDDAWHSIPTSLLYKTYIEQCIYTLELSALHSSSWVNTMCGTAHLLACLLIIHTYINVYTYWNWWTYSPVCFSSNTYKYQYIESMRLCGGRYTRTDQFVRRPTPPVCFASNTYKYQYRVAKNHRIPYLYRSFSAKVTYI